VLLQVFVQFVKPVQTGYPQDSDSRLVVSADTAAAAAAAAAAASAIQLCSNHVIGY
jgi:hypothetical protein